MAPYSIKEDFEATTFTVNPEPFNVGGWIGLTVQALICLGLLTMCSSMATSASYANREVAWGAFFVMLAFCALVVYLPWRSLKKRHLANDLARRPVQIHVCDKDLRTGDCRDPKQLVVPYSQFHRFVLRNALDERLPVQSGPTVLAGGTGVMGAAAMATTGALAGAANMERAYKAKKLGEQYAVSFQVVAEAQGVAHVLAQGMTEAGAVGLMKDLCTHIDERLGGAASFQLNRPSPR